MSNNTSTQKTTFWNFLQNNTIEMPIIQRDYAQGRKGKEELRKTFLGNLKTALDSEYPLTLDFVYGSSSENNRLNPLDGQQRLTTLWLLHWYVAYKANKLTDDVIATFKKFTYETRVSSREFCERLADFKTQKPDNFEGTISDFIQQQTWFYSAWKQDPTIQSMLRMLDDLERTFTENFVGMWNKLSEQEDNKCPISFYNLDLGKLKLTDDLYIKMNARGEQLTSFENFKADLIGYMNEQQKEVDDTDKEQWKKLLSPTDGIPIKMDTTWTDIFWQNKTTEGKIDDIYFAFLNRFFLNEFICKDKEKSAKEIENKATFKLLYGDKSNDSNVTYQGFEKYKACVTEKSLNSLQKTLDNFATFVGEKKLDEFNKLFQPKWKQEEEKNFYFFPKYMDGTITTLTQPQRVVFYAMCKYFEQDTYDETTLKQWMRIVWNLVENGNINTIEAMIGNIRFIDELSNRSHDIYNFLADDNSKITSQANTEQLKEEIEKVKKITKEKNWEKVIIKAESNEVLKGKIWILFQDNEETKLEIFVERLKLLEDIQKQGQEIDQNSEKRNSFFLQKILISYCKDCEESKKALKNSIDLACSPISKRKTLLTKDLSFAFRAIPSTIPATLNQEMEDDSWQKDIATTNLLDKSRGKKISSYEEDKKKYIVLWGTEGRKWSVFGNEVWGNIILGNPRNAILSKALKKKNGKITTEQEIEVDTEEQEKKYFFCDWEIFFKYSVDGNEYSFSCEPNGDVYVYLQKNKAWKRLQALSFDKAKISIEELKKYV